jgi:hypothetical protein
MTPMMDMVDKPAEDTKGAILSGIIITIISGIFRGIKKSSNVDIYVKKEPQDNRSCPELKYRYLIGKYFGLTVRFIDLESSIVLSTFLMPSQLYLVHNTNHTYINRI